VTGTRRPRGFRLRPAARAGGRRLPGALAVGCGLLLLVAAGLQAWRVQPVTETGSAAVERLTGPGPGTPVVSGEPAARQPPVRLRIGAIDLTARVDGIGVDPDSGELALPAADRAGWYRSGPGVETDRGSIVIAGHVDTWRGPGVFLRLAELAPGDEITLTSADGGRRTFEVVGREVHEKADLPLGRYFSRDGAPRLTLITCTGSFDRDDRGYRDNLVVTAVPA
jgi:hypothetical protein